MMMYQPAFNDSDTRFQYATYFVDLGINPFFWIFFPPSGIIDNEDGETWLKKYKAYWEFVDLLNCDSEDFSWEFDMNLTTVLYHKTVQ